MEPLVLDGLFFNFSRSVVPSLSRRPLSCGLSGFDISEVSGEEVEDGMDGGVSTRQEGRR